MFVSVNPAGIQNKVIYNCYFLMLSNKFFFLFFSFTADDVDQKYYGYGFTYVRSGSAGPRGRMNSSDANQWQARQYPLFVQLMAIIQVVAEFWPHSGRALAVWQNPINKPLWNTPHRRRILKGCRRQLVRFARKVADRAERAPLKPSAIECSMRGTRRRSRGKY